MNLLEWMLVGLMAADLSFCVWLRRGLSGPR